MLSKVYSAPYRSMIALLPCCCSILHYFEAAFCILIALLPCCYSVLHVITGVFRSLQAGDCIAAVLL